MAFTLAAETRPVSPAHPSSPQRSRGHGFRQARTPGSNQTPPTSPLSVSRQDDDPISPNHGFRGEAVLSRSPAPPRRSSMLPALAQR